jgi:hypothetical protein
MNRLVRGILAAAAVATALPALAQKTDPAPAHMAQLLFVQNASGVELGAGGRTLTLKGLSPTTLFFSPLQTQGLITEAQYQAESQKLLSQIVQ